jgi:hypothetical protein
MSHRGCGSSANRKLARNVQTGFGEISGDVRERDFWPGILPIIRPQWSKVTK